jgi:hypothetical protein
MSGPRSPKEPFPTLLSEVQVMSGPRSPKEPGNTIMAFGAEAGVGSSPEQDGRSLTEATPEAEVTAEKVVLRVSIRKRELLAVSISSPDPIKIKIQKVQIQIFDRKVQVASALLSAAHDTVVDESNRGVYALSTQEIKELTPGMVAGNTAVVTVEYFAQPQGQIHVSVIGHKRSHTIQDIIDHVVHKDSDE